VISQPTVLALCIRFILRIIIMSKVFICSLILFASVLNSSQVHPQWPRSKLAPPLVAGSKASSMKPASVFNITSTSACVNWTAPPGGKCSLWWTCNDGECCKNWTEVSGIKTFPFVLNGLTPATNCSTIMHCTMPQGVQLKASATVFTTAPAVIKHHKHDDSEESKSIEKMTMCCADGWIVFNGSCYSIIRKRLSWTEANKTCTDLGASLLEPMSIAEWDTIRVFAATNALTWISDKTTMFMNGNTMMWLVKTKEHGKISGVQQCIAYYGGAEPSNAYLHYYDCSLQNWAICKLVGEF